MRHAVGLTAPTVITVQGTVADCILVAASPHAELAPGTPYEACHHVANCGF